ncbi:MULTISPECIES: hypothetical protein [Burkholderia cepacia complex]|uniref:Uncharacterized protein n=1 Tax=Burkholderia orbicola (strain MC0-3) TaxID=406425 RepID=B1K1B2_BURO0|nr:MULTISPECIES: hypothetical protein [Burkholderia cepacia complex]ACA89200.1 hypothetical protein Bcenmc03_0019 [Burkholderia orbicola MC0-3]
MGIWKSPPVELEPVVFLSRWQVMETDKGFRHFIGHNTETMSGRASTPIVKFDPETRRGVTQSGRIYELIAESGVDFNANILWDITSAEIGVASTDVSSEYDQTHIASLQPAAPFIANLYYDARLRCLGANVPATHQSFEPRNPGLLADLLFAMGVRQGYLRVPNFDTVENRTEFIDLVRAVERRLNELERGLPRDADGPPTEEPS